MRTTIELPDGLMKRAKHAAVERGIPLREVMRQAMERFLGDPAVTEAPPAEAPPASLSRKPGSIHLTPDQVYEILIREERATYDASGGQ